MIEDLKDRSKPELTDLLAALGQRPYRAGQIFRWLYREGAVKLSDMKNLPATLIKELAEEFYISKPRLLDEKVSRADGTATFGRTGLAAAATGLTARALTPTTAAAGAAMGRAALRDGGASDGDNDINGELNGKTDGEPNPAPGVAGSSPSWGTTETETAFPATC